MVQTEHPSREKNGIGGGVGTATLVDWSATMPPNLNMLATVMLPPGASVGVHSHLGEAEIYRIIAGTGMYNDNGVDVEVHPGDVTMCPSGESHGIRNIGNDMLTFDAVIVGG